MSERFDDPIRALRAYARHLEDQVPGEMTRVRVERAFDTAHTPRKRAIALLVVGLLGVSNAALAQVSDPSVPGDTLYRIDRAYEKLTALVGSDHASERLDEASVMAARGQAVESLALVREALSDESGRADVDRARALIDQVGSEELPDDFTEALNTLIDAARAVSVSDDRQAAAQELGDKAKDVAEAAQELQKKAPATPPDTVPGNQAP